MSETAAIDHPPYRVVHSRHRDRDYVLRRTLLVADMAGLFLSLGLAMTVVGSRTAPLRDLAWFLPFLPFWALLLWSYRLYWRSIRRLAPTYLDDAPSLFHALVLGTLASWVYYRFVLPVPQLNLAELTVFAMVAMPMIICLRAVLRTRNLRKRGPERVFVVAPQDQLGLLQRKCENHPEYEMEVTGGVCPQACEALGLPLCAGTDEVERMIASGEVDHVVVGLDATYLPLGRTHELMRACHCEGIRFSCFLIEHGLLPRGIEVNHLEGMGLLTSPPPVLPRSARLLKRCLDVSVSSFALALLLPAAALIAAAVRFDSEGPAFYRQTRVGRDGRRFELFKFRTMKLGADKLDDQLMQLSADPHWLVLEEDPRLTGLGRFLRRSSLDELPQLWNVLRGDMSLVGPRPLSLRDDAKVVGWRRNRLDLVPGITGYWQVLGRNSIPFEEMLEVDYAYVASWSLWNDIRILLQTVPVVLRQRGAN